MIEDDLALGDALGRVLQGKDFDVTHCAYGAEALMMFRRYRPDVVLLDLSLPDMDGMEVLRLMRDGGSQVPVLVVTARCAVQDRVLGLEEGADDYLTKPFDIEELAARLKALVRRSQGALELRCAKLRVDESTGAVFRGATPLEVSGRELALLKALMAMRGQAIGKEDLHRAVFGDELVGADAIEVLVHRLRKRIQGSGAQLVTLRGVGYLMIDEAMTEGSAAA